MTSKANRIARDERRQARAGLAGRGRAAAVGGRADARRRRWRCSDRREPGSAAAGHCRSGRRPACGSSSARSSAAATRRRRRRAAADRDLVVAEEPLEIRIAGESLIVTMRTPGDDLDLAAGLLFTEGVIASMDDVAALVHGGETAGRDRENVVDVTAARGRRARGRGGAARAARDRRLRAVRQGEHRGGSKAHPARSATTRASRCRSCWDCRTRYGPLSRCSPRPAACTRSGCSRPTARCCWCARTSAGTTPSTR